MNMAMTVLGAFDAEALATSSIDSAGGVLTIIITGVVGFAIAAGLVKWVKKA